MSSLGAAGLLVAFAVTLGVADSRASVLPVDAELRIQIPTVAPLVIASAGVATVNGSGGGAHVQSVALGPGVVAGGPVLIPLTGPIAATISAVQLVAANQPGTVAETGGGTLGGPIGLSGTLRFCLFGTSGSCADPLANLDVPLTPAGVGGSAAVAGLVGLTVFGAPWTTGTASVGTVTAMGYRAGPASGTSSTAQAGGVIQLVTPIAILTNIEAFLPAFATLTLRFVPEPTTLLLLGAGVLALALGGARRG